MTAVPSKWPTARKLAWIEQIARDQGLAALALRLGVLLACKYINTERGYAWPSQTTLMADLNASENGVRMAARSLAKGGHLVVRAGAGRGVATEYWPRLSAPEKPAPDETLSEDKSSLGEDLFEGTKGLLESAEKVSTRAEKGALEETPLPLMIPKEGIPLRRARARKRRRLETALPDGCPTEAQIEEAQSVFDEAAVNLDARDAAREFRSHALANDRRLRDWPQGWRMWTAKAITFARERARSPARPQRRSGYSYVAHALMEDEK